MWTLEAVEAHGSSMSTVLRTTMTSWSNTARIQTRYRCEVVVFAMRTMMQFPQQTKRCKFTSQLVLFATELRKLGDHLIVVEAFSPTSYECVSPLHSI